MAGESFKAELLAPAGDFETALAAFSQGADAVYCGLADYSARAYAKNFSFPELKELIRYSHANGKKVYVTFNTIIDEAQMPSAIEILAKLEDANPDGIIVQDLGVAAIARRFFPRLELHASTQLVAHNLEGVLALKELGFKRVVLAREMTKEEISSIVKRCGTEIECFIHGALCYSISGLCLYSAIERNRSGNRGKCAYCCRQAFCAKEGDNLILPFSMKDLRLGTKARVLQELGVKSLKIEGRMKSPLYVASVTKYYRDILDGKAPSVREQDLETVFSRRTTSLYFDGRTKEADVIDTQSTGHLGTPIGIVKRITLDRQGRRWLRFKTSRALEKHDGLQFVSDEAAHPRGFGIDGMRRAISRSNVFTVGANEDIEVELPQERELDITPGETIYCAMSGEMKRRFPVPGFRPSDWPGDKKINIVFSISGNFAKAKFTLLDGSGIEVASSFEGDFEKAKNPALTKEACRKAFSRLGKTDYSLQDFSLSDPEGLFIPPAILNEMRRAGVERLDEARENSIREKIGIASSSKNDTSISNNEKPQPKKRLKIRLGDEIKGQGFDEIIALLPSRQEIEKRNIWPQDKSWRLALGVFNEVAKFNNLRSLVKKLLREGFVKWEVSDLATLRLLKSLGVEDITADWTLYAFNSSALEELSALGVRRFVASPENNAGNILDLANNCKYEIEFLARISTPLFISLNKSALTGNLDEIKVYESNGLWITVKEEPQTFDLPQDVPLRYDYSWDFPIEE